MHTDPSTESRNAEITGRPPRISLQRTEEVLVPARELMAAISGAASGSTATVADEHIPEMLITAMCHRELFEKVVGVSLQLLKEPALPLRDRQLVILRVGWLRQIPYIWGEHVNVSKKLGLCSEDIEQVTVGSTSPHWRDHERALLEATEELIDRAMISDATWAVLARQFDARQLFELPVLVGQFSTVGYFQNALRIPLSPGNEGLRSR
jgi:4-carboxymuconolactone decarboxylase